MTKLAYSVIPAAVIAAFLPAAAMYLLSSCINGEITLSSVFKVSSSPGARLIGCGEQSRQPALHRVGKIVDCAWEQFCAAFVNRCARGADDH